MKISASNQHLSLWFLPPKPARVAWPPRQCCGACWLWPFKMRSSDPCLEDLRLTHPPGSGFGISSWDGADEIPGNPVLIGFRPRGPFQTHRGSHRGACVLRGAWSRRLWRALGQCICPWGAEQEETELGRRAGEEPGVLLTDRGAWPHLSASGKWGWAVGGLSPGPLGCPQTSRPRFLRWRPSVSPGAAGCFPSSVSLSSPFLHPCPP